MNLATAAPKRHRGSRSQSLSDISDITTPPFQLSQTSYTMISKAAVGQSWIISSQAGPSRLPISSTIRQFSTTSRQSARTHGHHVSHYDALTLPKNASKQQIKARFYELSKKYHPDAKGGDTAKFHEINDAYAILGDDGKRRTYDLSLVPASQAPRPHSTSHSSFTPNDPYLARNARGPHQAWRAHYPHTHQMHGHDYTPFGRKTPPNFQYEYTYNFNASPNARRPQGAGTSARRKAREGEAEEEEGGGGTGGIWKFVVTVGMILTVVSLGGGLTAQSSQQWQIVESVERAERLGECDVSESRSGVKGDI